MWYTVETQTIQDGKYNGLYRYRVTEIVCEILRFIMLRLREGILKTVNTIGCTDRVAEIVCEILRFIMLRLREGILKTVNTIGCTDRVAEIVCEILRFIMQRGNTLDGKYNRLYR